MNKIKSTLIIIVTLFISFLLISLNDTNNRYYGAKQIYRVYLNGNSIGLIKEKEELENYIDKEQQSIKEKYNVSKVYIPNGLEIKPELTYSDDIKKANDVYENIKDLDSFTIQGYIIKITKNDGEEKAKPELIYVLNKDIFNEAINNTILAFINEEDYKAYINETQPVIPEMSEGEEIERVYIKEKITIKKDYIPVDSEIFTDSKTLSKYLLYGTTESQKVYTVKDGDTVSSIANENQLNVREFLIANRDILSTSTLLYTGQQVVVDLIKPKITLIEEIKQYAFQEKDYKTEIVEDSSFYVGYSEVVQQGVKGEELVSRNVKKENGKVATAININTIETKTPINRVVKTGSKSSFVVGNTGIWAWPTRSGYLISTYFGYDSGTYSFTRYHEAIDITGTGCGSPIYSANDGTVITSKWHNSFGYYIEINHNNGYITRYAHLSKMFVSVGQAVSMGEVIGTMGSTGESTGCHLHFAVSYNNTWFDPFQLYK